jgi:hypothetical protein
MIRVTKKAAVADIVTRCRNGGPNQCCGATLFYAAPRPGKNFDAAPTPALTLLQYVAGQIFGNEQMLIKGCGVICPRNLV